MTAQEKSNNVNQWEAGVRISIVIPTYNEEDHIADLLKYLEKHGPPELEILVVDGKSTDDTVQEVRKAGFRCLESPTKGRGAQMNYGAANTSGELLYFVHADTLPPKSYASDITRAVQMGHESGCYRFSFNSDNLMLKINSWFTRFDVLMCRGGDQSLFILRSVFEKMNGFKNYDIMEDFEFIRRLRNRNTFTIIPKSVQVSARKYHNNHYLKVNLVNLVIFTMFQLGVSQKTMVHAYTKLIENTRFGDSV